MSFESQKSADFRKAKKAALDLLDDFAYSTPRVDPVKIARGLGIKVFFADFDEQDSNISGFFYSKENEIYVNRDDPPFRQTFTVAHELGHKILHQDWLDSSDYEVLLRDPLTPSHSDPKEQEANSFAANLLVPFFMLKEYYGFCSIDELSKIFMVSTQVIANRIKSEYGR